MTSYIGLDFETYGGVDLPKHGLNRYVMDSTFKPLIACTWNSATDNNIFDLVLGRNALGLLAEEITDKVVIAHNAGFEKAVLKHLGMDHLPSRYLDSAFVSRAVGGASKLEVAAPQLLNTNKVDTGKGLIKLFACPGKLQEANDSLEFDPDIIALHPAEWEEFKRYCLVDAELGFNIGTSYQSLLPDEEHVFQSLTQEMNENGWFVDLHDVAQMQRIYEANTSEQLDRFRNKYDIKGELNFNSHPQLVKWCADRNVKAKSFDEANVEKMLHLITVRLDKLNLNEGQITDLFAVKDLLVTKQMLGGSSLKKLTTIENMVGADGRVYDQYVHVGAGQTWRTSGRGVQMQNLKRLTTVADMAMLHTDANSWSNDDLAVNLRQVFRAEHPDGQLIVGDFASIESRGLAYSAGENWKLQAYRRNEDLYKVLAASMFNVGYDNVTKLQRQTGKVGELSCGYGAGGGAVKAFSANMGVTLTDAEAAALVADWRAANPMVLSLWSHLDAGLKKVVEGPVPSYTVALANSMTVRFAKSWTPPSLSDMHPTAQSVQMTVYQENNEIGRRFFHGCYMRGNNVGYYKPTDLLNGDPWKNHYRDPKTKEIVFFTLYGGKLAGLLTQSLCRQMFFVSLRHLQRLLKGVDNVKIIGQFHDEIVLEWQPEPFEDQVDVGNTFTIPLSEAVARMQTAMTYTELPGFPIAAEIKYDHRYTK